MIKAIIVEDDPYHQKELVNCLKMIDTDFDIKAITTTVEESYLAIMKFEPQLVFLDIDLAFGDNGFDLLKRFDKLPFAVIFVTSFVTFENILLAIRACALDFLSKPVIFSDLERAVTEFIKRGSTILEQTQSLRKNITNKDGRVNEIWLTPKQGEGKVKVEVSDIFYCKSEDDCTHFFLIQPVGKFNKITSSKGIGEWEAILENSGIIRTHNRYLVNLNYVQRYIPDVNNATLIIVNPKSENKPFKEIPVSRSRRGGISGRFN